MCPEELKVKHLEIEIREQQTFSEFKFGILDMMKSLKLRPLTHTNTMLFVLQWVRSAPAPAPTTTLTGV